MGKRLDICGKKYGCLTVMNKAESKKYGKCTVGRWNVRCDCGLEKIINVGSIINGTHKYCGIGCSLSSEVMVDCKCDVCLKEFKRKKRVILANKSCELLCRKCSATKNAKKATESVRGKKSPNRLPDGIAALNSLYGAYKRNAVNQRKIPFEITLEQFKQITSMNCNYCGSVPSQNRDGDALRSKGKSSGKYIYNGIDRMDSSIGYIMSNIVTCCSSCNFMKRHWSVEFFLSHVNKIAEFTKSRNLN